MKKYFQKTNEHQMAIPNQLIQNIRAGDNQAILQLYHIAFKYCASYVLRNGGVMEDAKDIFQEALLVFIEKLRKEKDFVIEHDVKAYLYFIVRNLWLKRLRKEKKDGLELVLDEQEQDQDQIELFDEIRVKEKNILEARHQQLSEQLKSLHPTCRELLNLTFYENEKDKGIALIMNYSHKFVRVKRKRCIDELKKKMLSKNINYHG